MTVEISQPRAGQAAACFLAFQSAKGTVVDDFTASDALRLWTASLPMDYGAGKFDSAGSITHSQQHTDGRKEVVRLREGTIVVNATPEAIEWALRSSWGPRSANVFQYKENVQEWLTIALVEDRFSASKQKLIRLYDAWIHRVRLEVDSLGMVSLSLHYAAEHEATPLPLDALGGVTLPAVPMDADMRHVYPGRLALLVRDQGGEEEEIPFEAVVLDIDQRLEALWDGAKGAIGIGKGGYPGPKVALAVSARVGLETWNLIDDQRATAGRQYSLLLTDKETAETLFQADLYNVDFTEPEPLGHDGPLDAHRLVIAGEANLDDSGNFVTLTLDY